MLVSLLVYVADAKIILDNIRLIWYYSYVNQAEAAASHLRASGNAGLYGETPDGYLCARLFGPPFCLPAIFTEVKNIKELRINEEIRAPEVRLLIDGEENVILSLRDALQLAADKGLDLVEISPQARPPVCRVMNYGKYRFEQNKREKESRRNQKVVQIKEVKFRPNIEEHDFDTKVKNAERFLLDGDKVKATVMFRGREVTHPELGRVLCQRMTERLAEIANVERPPKLEGKNMVIIFVPKGSK